jgi:TetR/AcrR family transcriptional regulator, transcriptional repressor for nem operon
MRTARSVTSTRGRRPRLRVTDRAAQKRRTHERILRSGATIARREGLRAASVPRVMSGAGLTTGGFYAHFPSKTAMDVAIVRTLLNPLLGPTDLDGASGLEWLQRAVKRYLSAAHRDTVDGCGYPAVLSEIASAPSEVRRAFAEALQIRVAVFEPHVPLTTGVTVRERALATMALTIGGLLLARAARGAPISEELLSACRSWALPEANGGDSRPQSSSR